MSSKFQIFKIGFFDVSPHLLSVIPFGIIFGAIGIELGFDPIMTYLARNARTSQEMIDRFYASQLKGEDNIGMIQSRRKRRRID